MCWSKFCRWNWESEYCWRKVCYRWTLSWTIWWTRSIRSIYMGNYCLLHCLTCCSGSARACFLQSQSTELWGPSQCFISISLCRGTFWVLGSGYSLRSEISTSEALALPTKGCATKEAHLSLPHRLTLPSLRFARGNPFHIIPTKLQRCSPPYLEQIHIQAIEASMTLHGQHIFSQKHLRCLFCPWTACSYRTRSGVVPLTTQQITKHSTWGLRMLLTQPWFLHIAGQSFVSTSQIQVQLCCTLHLTTNLFMFHTLKIFQCLFSKNCCSNLHRFKLLLVSCWIDWSWKFW